jgi:GT2 family glycosyltransferase
MTGVDVRIGIVSWNTAELLERCLAAIPDAVGPRSAEVVVVDNASTDASVEVAARYDVHVHANAENVGYARAMNQALSGTTAPYLIALNPDTVPAPGSLARLVAALDERPDVAIACPRLLNPDGSVQHSVYRFPSLALALVVAWLPLRLHRGAIGRRFWLEGHAPHDHGQEVDWAIGAVHCMRAAAVGPVPYSERWFMYVEDLDLCWQMRKRGRPTLFVPEAEVVHVGNASGVQAWGEERTARWVDATFDWYVRERGVFAARLWEAANTAGMAGKLAVAVVGLFLRLPGRANRRHWAVQLRAWLWLHGRKLFYGSRKSLSAASPKEPTGPT